jgi:hypothetical protein
MAESWRTNKPRKTITRTTSRLPDTFDGDDNYVKPSPRRSYSWTPRQEISQMTSRSLSTHSTPLRLPSEQLKTHAHDKSRREKSVEIAALKPKDWKKVSVKHREKFERLSVVWKNAKSNPELIKIINANGVCFKEELSIGSGSYGTEVYVCLGSDGIERAIKRLPKVLCNLLKCERDILMSRNAVVSPRVVNYCFYDDSKPEYDYLILNLYEQNLEEFIKEKGETITESRARKMIRQVLEGLQALHSREPRILHRDLKPTNILVDVNGDLVLSDFCIGRFFPEQGIFTRYLTKLQMHATRTEEKRVR